MGSLLALVRLATRSSISRSCARAHSSNSSSCFSALRPRTAPCQACRTAAPMALASGAAAMARAARVSCAWCSRSSASIRSRCISVSRSFLWKSASFLRLWARTCHEWKVSSVRPRRHAAKAPRTTCAEARRCRCASSRKASRSSRAAAARRGWPAPCWRTTSACASSVFTCHRRKASPRVTRMRERSTLTSDPSACSMLWCRK
mmetsp:Transcript_43961/g.124171  ORF Transcript_43961/g.124171 Transcript_43961/m.124171 type:complete len:204 (-) Transcript_43961:900-1511(-)